MNFDTVERYKTIQVKWLRIDCNLLRSCLLSLTSLALLTSILNHGVNGCGTKMRGVITVLVKMTLETTSTNTITKALNHQRRRGRGSVRELET